MSNNKKEKQKYYKYYNYKIADVPLFEFKKDGKVTELSAPLIGEILTLGDIITKEEYDAD